MDLSQLGWDSFFDAHFYELRSQGLVPARVVREHKQLYAVYWERGELSARVSGKMMHTACSRADFPAVGDWVGIAVRPEEGKATIHAVLPRKSKFCRKVAWVRTEEQVAAANIDTVFLVSALDVDFNLRRLERYLTLAWESGAKPVVVLNKTDLCSNVRSTLADAEAIAFGVPVHAISALEGKGLDDIRIYLCSGQTGALLGSSGVGKSTIINSLLGQDLLEVGEVRPSDGKGRHVTSTRQLVVLPTGGAIIDTPGMRELQLWADEKSLEGSFDDIEDLAGTCRFRDCRHQSEPGCAIKDAIESGRLSADRFRSYVKLKKELALLSVRKEQRARLREKQWKQIARWSRQRAKHDPKSRE
jgi:ribosome biogenesis GTPase